MPRQLGLLPLALVALLGSACAPLPPRPGAPFGKLTVETTNPDRPGRLEIRPVGIDYVVAACESLPCEAQMPSGGYRLTFVGRGSTTSRSDVVELRAAGTTVSVSPGTWNSRGPALAMGIVGPTLMLTGLVSTMFDGCHTDGGSHRGCNSLPAALIVTGLFTTIFGWLFYSGAGSSIHESPQLVLRDGARDGALFRF